MKETKDIEKQECTCDCQENEECNCDESCACSNEKKPIKKEKKKGVFNKKDKVQDKIKKLEKEIQELQDKELRTKAELVNFRRRKDEETARLLKYANEDLVKELLSTIDNFERAIDMDDDNLEDEVSKFLSGFKMIYCNLSNTLKNYEVTEIEAMNQVFDPTVHQAVMTDHVDGIESGMVIEVLQKGYKLKDKVIRPAMVKVNE